MASPKRVSKKRVSPGTHPYRVRLTYHITEGTRIERREGAAHRVSIHAARNYRAASDHSARRPAARRRRGGNAAASLQPRRFHPRADRSAKPCGDRSGQSDGGGRARRRPLHHRLWIRLRSSANRQPLPKQPATQFASVQSERHDKSPPARAVFSKFRAPTCSGARRRSPSKREPARFSTGRWRPTRLTTFSAGNPSARR